MPAISVIVPVYNVEKYLHACLDSILAQTFTDFELILIDDGSPDSSGKICDEYAEKDSRIRAFHQENKGQAAARNFGVSQAKAEWIHFVDSDDIIHPQMLDLLYEAVKLHNVKIAMALLSSSHDKAFEEMLNQTIDRRSILLKANEKTLLQLVNDHRYHSVCSKLIYIDILRMFPFEQGRIHEDSPVICKWLYYAKEFAYSPNTLYIYRENPTSTTRNRFNLKRLDLIWAWEQQEDFYDSIDFRLMKRRIEWLHIFTVSVMYKKMMQDSSQFKKVAKGIRRKTLIKYFSAFFNTDYTKEDKLFIIENFNPKITVPYWIVAERCKKIRQKGRRDCFNENKRHSTRL